jgi:hypothetical protein
MNMSFLGGDRDIASNSWHWLAHPVRAAVWLAAIACIGSACGTTVDGTGGSGGSTTTGFADGGGGTGGGPHGVPCASAQNGDPCDSPGESCGVSECYGCFSQCMNDHSWMVTCNDPPPCPADPLPKHSSCDDFCETNTGCSYTVQTSCGPQTLAPVCGPLGWEYEVSCQTDCGSITDPTACDAAIDCMWIVSCSTSPSQVAMCIPSSNPFGSCSAFSCQQGEVCQDVVINPDNPHSMDCSQASGNMPVCTPAPMP